MRIFSKKAFQFDHPAGQEPAVVVQAGTFTDVPAWVGKSIMFKLAASDEDVTVIENKQDQKAAETGGKPKTAAEKKAEAEKAKAAAVAAAADQPDPAAPPDPANTPEQ